MSSSDAASKGNSPSRVSISSLGSLRRQSPAGSYSRLTRLSQHGSPTHCPSPRSRTNVSTPRTNEVDIPALLREIEGNGSLKAKETAVATLCNVTLEPQGQKAVVENGALPVVLSILMAPWADLTVRDGAAGILYNVASSDDGRLAIVRAGGFTALGNMLDDPAYNTDTRQMVTATLRLICMHTECKKLVVRTSVIESLVAVINSAGEAADTAEAKMNAISVMQSLSFTDQSNAVDWGKRGILAALIHFVQSTAPQRSLDMEEFLATSMSISRKSPRSKSITTAATVLQNLSAFEANKPYIIEAGGVGTMLTLIAESREDEGVQKAAASVLFNLAVSGDCCEAILQEGSVDVLLETLREQHPCTELRRFTAGTLQYLSATKKGVAAIIQALLESQRSGSGFVQNLLGDEDSEQICQHIAGLARNLTQDPEALDAALVETAIVPGLLRQLHRSYVYDTKEEYLVASLHNLAFMQDRNKEVIVEAGGLDIIFRMLGFGSVKHGAVERLGALLQTLTVSAANEVPLLPSLQQLFDMLLNHHHSVRAREFVIATIQNVSVHPDVKAAILHKGGINAVLTVLKDNRASIRTLECALGILQNLSNHQTIKQHLADDAVLKLVLQRLTSQDGARVSEKQKEYGMGFFLNVAVVEPARAFLVASGAIALMIRCINSTITTPACKQYSAVALHRLCCRHDDLLASIRREGGALALGRVVDTLPDPAAQECVRWTLKRMGGA
eukprot:EG_transcript_2987